MIKEKLIQGQTDARIEVEVDYESGGQVSESVLSNAQALEIQYKWNVWDDATETSGTWTADGYAFDGTTPYLYYEFSGTDAVPDDARRLVGRAKITDENGRISLGNRFEIEVYSSEL